MDIILADDHALVREGLRVFLETLGEDAKVIEAENFDEAFQAATDAEHLQMVILDLSMPGMDGLAGASRMMSSFQGIPVVILSGTHDNSIIMDALNLGVSGFIPKSSGSEVMMSALQLIMAGERYVPSKILSYLDPMASGPQAQTAPAEPSEIPSTVAFNKLSKRERKVLELLVRGMTNKEIARAIDLQEATIKIHVKNIYRKIGVSNRAQAVRMAIQPDWQSESADPPS